MTGRKLAIVAVLLSATGCDHQGTPTGELHQAAKAGSCNGVTLSISPKAKRYHFNQNMFIGPVAFTATLKNCTSSPVTVSAVATGNIAVVSATGNGQPLTYSTQPASMFDGGDAIQSNSLVTVDPKKTTSFTIAGLAPEVLAPGQTPTINQYVPNTTGTYSVTFSYQYSGSDYGHSNVFRDTIQASPVTFSVIQ